MQIILFYLFDNIYFALIKINLKIIMTILLHLGIGKTGSTFIQRNILNNLFKELSISYNPTPTQPILNLLNPKNHKTI